MAHHAADPVGNTRPDANRLEMSLTATILAPGTVQTTILAAK